MKTFIALMLIILALTLTACGESSEVPGHQPGQQQAMKQALEQAHNYVAPLESMIGPEKAAAQEKELAKSLYRTKRDEEGYSEPGR